MQSAKSAIYSWLKKIPTGLAGAAFWLAVWFGLLYALRLLPGGWGTFFTVIQFFTGIALAAVAIPLVFRFVRRHLLWSLRNKLVVTYLLIGLAPVVLFVTLVLISAYVAAGQFSIHLVDSRIQEQLSDLSGVNVRRTETIARLINEGVLLRTPRADWTGELEPTAASQPHRDTLAYINGAPIDLGIRPKDRTPLGLPPWALDLKAGHSQGLVLDGGELYLTALQQRRLLDGRQLWVVSSTPVNGPLVGTLSKGLGRVRFLVERLGSRQTAPGRKTAEQQANRSIAGGSDPTKVNLADVQVRFLSTLAMTDWDTGEHDNVPIEVASRPSLLYQQLFGSSIGGVVTDVYRIGLIVLCVLFALIELLALIMAIRLSRTMTASVADLYEATQKIDRGELGHRIGVQRSDQLAELSRSFNTMTGSLQRLLEEQKEKERLQNELSIAQEVQANLFPQRITSLEHLELHGICRPARTVSGDYYDFLVFHEESHNGTDPRRASSPGLPSTRRRETGLGLAIGDISGKGISAALLMATLHSAVRAYRFASEELVYSRSALAGLMANRDLNGKDCDELF
ncbi:MAG TPA: HAMP domain-containing protein, partial [Edaphobacter sp.]